MVVSHHHLSAQMVEARIHRMTEVVARLAPGTSLDRAKSEVAAVSARMRTDHRDAYAEASNYRVEVIPFRNVLGERARLTLWLLMAAAAFVMVICAANVANLTLMRGIRREHELVVRAALGAGMGRLRRLLLVEHLVLTTIGAALGALIAVEGVGLLTSLAERYSPRASEIELDGSVLGFTVALSVSIAVVLSFLASLPREGALGVVSAGVKRMTGNPRKQRLQRGLVVAQVAVSVVLLAGAGLLTRTMIQLSNVDTGLETEQVLTMQVSLLTTTQLLTDPGADATAKAQYERMRVEIAALPGVVEAGVGSPAPLRSSDVRFDVKAEGKPVVPGEPMPNAELRTAGPEFFRAAGIPLVAGRPFYPTDRAGSGLVVIISKTLADRLFPGEDPVGKRIAWTGDVLRFTPISPAWRTVVGVARNTQDGGLDAESRPAVFMPFAQMIALGGNLVIRSAANASDLIADATRIVRRIAPTVPIEHVMTVEQIKQESVAPRRLNAMLVSSFGILALFIAAVGIAGVLGFSVSARTNEIGIRMSLGAESGRVQRMILREGGVLVAVGLIVGITGGFFAARIIRGLLFAVAPHDPVTFVAVAATMAAIGTIACWIPALRAARIDPAITMRS
jgi:predicted permease